MDPVGTAPPAAESCLVSSYASRGEKGQKGGTIVDERVMDLAAHEAQMKEPAGYRPAQCVCGGRRLHIHDRRERTLRGKATEAGGYAVVMVMVFLCVSCSATWRILPAFLARCLWRSWDVVEGAVQGTRSPREPEVPERTQRRWRARLAQAARVPMQVLAVAGGAALREVAQAAGLDGDRKELLQAYGRQFCAGVAVLAPLATLLHRLTPGIRLM